MNNIKALRKQANLSQLELSQLCGVHQTAVSQWEQGKTNPDMETLMLLAQIFNTTLDTVLGLDTPDAPVLIPLKGILENGEITFVDESDFSEALPFNLQYGKKEDYFALRIEDDCMEPTFLQGDTVIFRNVYEFDNNDIITLTVNDASAFVRRVRLNKDSFILSAEKPDSQVICYSKEQLKKLNIKFFAKAVELRREII